MDFASLNRAAICLAEVAARMSTTTQAMNVADEAFLAANIDTQAMFSRTLATSDSDDETSDTESYESVLEDLGTDLEGNGPKGRRIRRGLGR